MSRRSNIENLKAETGKPSGIEMVARPKQSSENKENFVPNNSASTSSKAKECKIKHSEITPTNPHDDNKGLKIKQKAAVSSENANKSKELIKVTDEGCPATSKSKTQHNDSMQA